MKKNWSHYHDNYDKGILYLINTFFICAIVYGCVGGLCGGKGWPWPPLSRITLKLWAAIPEMEGRGNISSEQLLNTSNTSHTSVKITKTNLVLNNLSCIVEALSKIILIKRIDWRLTWLVRWLNKYCGAFLRLISPFVALLWMRDFFCELVTWMDRFHGNWETSGYFPQVPTLCSLVKGI